MADCRPAVSTVRPLASGILALVLVTAKMLSDQRLSFKGSPLPSSILAWSNAKAKFCLLSLLRKKGLSLGETLGNGLWARRHRQPDGHGSRPATPKRPPGGRLHFAH